jgi:hypothetical protein
LRQGVASTRRTPPPYLSHCCLQCFSHPHYPPSSQPPRP